MIKRGRLEGPFTHILATSKTQIVLDADYVQDEKRNLRSNGAFWVKIFDNIPLQENFTNYLAVKAIYIDNGIINFNKNVAQCQYFRSNVLISSPSEEVAHCSSPTQYIDKLLNLPVQANEGEVPPLACIEDGSNNHLYYTKLMLRAGEKIILNTKTAKILGLEDIMYEGPVEKISALPIDLYYHYNPLIVTTPLIEETFVGENILPVLSSVPIDHPLIGNRTIYNEEGELHWKKLIVPIRDYIYLQIVDCFSKPIAFCENCDITIHLIIRSSPYEIL